MLALTQTTPPAAEPVTLAEAKLFARVTNTAEDALFDRLIAAARGQIEDWTGYQLINATWELALDGFPRHLELPASRIHPEVRRAGASRIVIPKPPLRTIDLVQYVDPDGIEQTLASSVYQADNSSRPGELLLAYGQSWPETRRQRHAVTVTFSAGFGSSPDDVPAKLRLAVLVLVTDSYDHRDRSTKLEDNQRIMDLLGDYHARLIV